MLDQITSFLSLFVGLLGFLVIIFIAMSFKKSPIFNLYLLIFFFIISFRLIHVGLIGFYDVQILSKYNVYLGPIYLFAIPSAYLFFESIYTNRIYFKPRYLLHLIFPFANLALNSLHHIFPILNSDPIESIQVYSILSFIAGYLAAAIYLAYKNWRKRRQIPFKFSIEQESKMRKWSIYLLTITLMLSFCLLYSMYIEFQGKTRIMGYHLTLIKSVLWFFVFVKILRSPELLYGYPNLKNIILKIDEKPTEINSVWSTCAADIKSAKDAKLKESIDSKIESYLRQTEDYVTLNNPFRNNKFTIKDLANSLNMPLSHLVYIFKYHSEISFVEYRNQQRVKDATNFIHLNFLETQTFQSLAITIGFASYNSFFISFKKHTGLSPKDYIESLPCA
jgi:AraC-like DNA-binding protein